MKCDKCIDGLYYDAAHNAYVCRYCDGTGVTPPNQCATCSGVGKVQRVDPMDNSYCRVNCATCGGEGFINGPYRKHACPCGDVAPTLDREGRLIRAAGDVMRAQRLKGIAKYKSTLEDQNGYNITGMIDMAAEELADGAVYVQKLREMHLALLDELEGVLTAPKYSERARIVEALRIINREKNRA